MRSIFCSLAILLSILISGTAQAQSTASITSVKQNGERTEVTVSSAKKFYVGGSTHVLHIGNKEFSLNKQVNKEGKGTIIFYIPAAEFNALTEGEEVYMTYGSKFRKGTDPKDVALFCKKNPKVCWYLGKFTKTL
jgi:hypothetical protein